MLRRRPDPVVTRGGAAAFGIVIAIGAIALAIPLLPGESAPREGDIAPRAFAAVRESEYVSVELTAAAQDEAAAAVEPVMASLTEVPAEQLRLLASLFEEVARLRLRSELSSEERLEALGESPSGMGLGQAIRSTLLTLSVQNLEDLRAASVEGVSAILSSPLREEDKANRIEAYLLVGTVPSFQRGEGALRELLDAFVTPTVALDEQTTRGLREDAREAVGQVVVTYAPGEVIVEEGQALDAVAIEALRETGVIDEGFDYYDLGAGLLMGAALGTVLGVYLYRLQPFERPAERRGLMTLLAVLGTLVAVRVALPELLPDTEGRFFAYAMPVGAAALVVSSVSAPRFGAMVAVVVALYAGFIAATAPSLAGAAFTSALEPLELVIAYAAAGLAGAAAMQRTERLGRFAAAGVAVGAATGAVLLAFWMLTEQRETEGLGWLALAAAIAGGGSSVIGLGLHVLLSMALRVTTRMQLMELAQAGHPILQELQEKAPGTFHHSMLVGTLAEQAASRIGADSLLVRAGAYYHDIGKMERPEYFVENNIERGVSPHDSLAPEASARIIHGHVFDGMDLARRRRLPAIVGDFIPQHHGTRLVDFFYHKALERGETDAEEFRYPGPRPQAKEQAIVMLADSCEALVRATQPETHEEIDELVNGVFAERLSEGQMDECDITMHELQVVAESFRSTLRAVYHPRIEYPDAPGFQDGPEGSLAGAPPAVGPTPTGPSDPAEAGERAADE
ncbi:MAG: HDIG domain-containing protein [Chloroflexi bacterium]|nr:HDIG domain-containing protein [Chloroflexota bacterium]